MSIYLVNPSDISFGTAVITPRWLYVLAPRHPPVYGDPVIVDETLEPLDFTAHPGRATSSASAFTPSNALRGYEDRASRRESGAPRSSSAASTPRCTRTKPTSSAARTRRQGRRRRRVGPGAEGGARRHAHAHLRWRPRGRRQLPAGPVGPAAARQLHVGVGADRARLPEALLVLLGLANRRPGAAAAGRRCGRPGDRRSCGAWASASSRWPTTTSTRSRCKTWRWPRRSGRQDQPAEAPGAARRALRADGAAGEAARRPGLLSPRSPWKRPRIPSSWTR